MIRNPDAWICGGFAVYMLIAYFFVVPAILGWDGEARVNGLLLAGAHLAVWIAAYPSLKRILPVGAEGNAKLESTPAPTPPRRFSPPSWARSSKSPLTATQMRERWLERWQDYM